MRILLLLALFIICASAEAQTKYKIDQRTVAVDSLDKEHPFKTWPELQKQGYGVRPENPKDPNTRFVVVRMSSEQIRRRDSLQALKLTPLKKGDPIRSFTTTDIDGNTVAVTDSTTAVVVLNFWFINCSPCRREMPGLNEIRESYRGDERVKFYAIALDKKPELIPFLEQSRFTYTIIPDGQNLAYKYGIEAYPTSIVIKNGKLVYTDIGIGLGALKTAISKALK